jgi:hypothetical protein
MPFTLTSWTDQNIRYAVLETVLHPVNIIWQLRNVDSKSRGGKISFIVKT